MSLKLVESPRGGEGTVMERNVWTPALAGMPQGHVAGLTLANRATRNGARARWEAQSWRSQLRDPAEYERTVARGALVLALLAEGLTVEAEVARFAGTQEEAGCISIAQVVRFADALVQRMVLARTDDAVLQLAHLCRDAESLAERMIDWANAGRL
ncbi:MAG TPA: hypothetical protein VE153_19790 [Myxococcus sp.]|nr:hypothetical protein [Myxococcus sp.]